eukprot:gb/GEZN01000895.1/.p1 GENE.gb/GEZN01000895.1/~~gb/GEZN01000895.1/.p1  ORF type:complete len:1046 (-),score=159.68 gb/GEZN01000895.1/:170-3307(-)
MVDNARRLTLLWAVPSVDMDASLRTAISFLSGLAGDEREGSLAALLEGKGWVRAVVVGLMDQTSFAAVFGLDLELSEEGFRHREDIVPLCLYMLSRLRVAAEAGELESLYYEQVNLARTAWIFNLHGDNLDYMQDLSELMRFRSGDDLLTADELWDDYSSNISDSMSKLFGLLTPANMLVLAGAPLEDLQQPKLDLPFTEKWYGTQYRTDPFSPQLLTRLKDSAAGKTKSLSIEALALLQEKSGPLSGLQVPPGPNEFIPQKLEIREDLPNRDYDFGPTLLKEAFEQVVEGVYQAVRVWHVRDAEKQIPDMVLRCSLFSTVGVEAKLWDGVAGNLFVLLVKQLGHNEDYPAGLAGFEADLESTGRRLDFSVSGFADLTVFKKFLYQVVVRLSHPEWLATLLEQKNGEHLLDRIKAARMDEEYNKLFGQPIDLAQACDENMQYFPTWPLDDWLVALQKMDLHDVVAWQTALLAASGLECLVSGEVSEQEAIDLVQIVQEELGYRTNSFNNSQGDEPGSDLAPPDDRQGSDTPPGSQKPDKTQGSDTPRSSPQPDKTRGSNTEKGSHRSFPSWTWVEVSSSFSGLFGPSGPRVPPNLLPRAIGLRQGRYRLFTRGFNPNDPNSAVVHTYRTAVVSDDPVSISAATNDLRLLFDVLAFIIDQPAYTELRTKEQLGYIVWTLDSTPSWAPLAILRVEVQSAVFSAAEVSRRIAAFVASFVCAMHETMTQEAYSEVIRELSLAKESEVVRPDGRVPQWWKEIIIRQYNFNRPEGDISELLPNGRLARIEVFRSFLRTAFPFLRLQKDDVNDCTTLTNTWLAPDNTTEQPPPAGQGVSQEAFTYWLGGGDTYHVEVSVLETLIEPGHIGFEQTLPETESTVETQAVFTEDLTEKASAVQAKAKTGSSHELAGGSAREVLSLNANSALKEYPWPQQLDRNIAASARRRRVTDLVSSVQRPLTDSFVALQTSSLTRDGITGRTGHKAKEYDWKDLCQQHPMQWSQGDLLVYGFTRTQELDFHSYVLATAEHPLLDPLESGLLPAVPQTLNKLK